MSWNSWNFGAGRFAQKKWASGKENLGPFKLGASSKESERFERAPAADICLGELVSIGNAADSVI